MGELKPYPEYKDSGVAWIGQIPKHWQVMPGHACFYEKNEPNIGLKEKTVLSLSYGKIVVKPEEKLHGLIPASFETYQIIDPEDIVIRPTDLQNDWNSLRFGLAGNRGIITSAYMCFQTTGTMDPKYGHLLLHTYDLNKVFYGLGSGLRQNLDWTDFKYLPCLVPPLPEQEKIVRYHRWIEQQLFNLINTKRRLIELLNEQKQMIISRAVTRGLDPNVRLKPSGIEWLGDVPEHWNVKRLKNLVQNVNEQVSTKDPDDLYIALENIESWTGRLILPDSDVTFESQVRRFRQDDILFGKLRPYLAKVTRPIKKGVCVSELLVLRKKTDDISQKWLEQKLRSKQIIDLINSSTFGAKMPRADWSFIGNLAISYPVSDEEQNKILVFIDDQTDALDQLIINARDEIGIIHEYQTRLISDIVTGKVDLRSSNISDDKPLDQKTSDR